MTNEYEKLNTLLQGAASELQHSSDGVLSLSVRKDIWIQMNLLDENSADNNVGRERRVRLDQLCVKHVMSLWSQVFPDDQGPLEMLAVAEKVVAAEIDDKSAQRLRDDFFTDVVENREYPNRDFSAMFIGHAAANTIISALIKDDSLAIPEVDDDEDLDPESYDPSYLCACAAGGGMNVDADANIEKRKSFWMWYLTHAVSEAVTN